MEDDTSDLDYIAAGVKKDCMKLIEKFCEHQTYDFKTFQDIWKEMKFPFVYGLRETFAELIEFTEEVFLIVKNLWLQYEDLYSSICAFYILIGVYQKQPTRNMVKIRLTFNDLQSIFLFLKKSKSNGIKNVLQLYYELDRDGAFVFVVFERQYGFERNLRKYFHNPPDLRAKEEEKDIVEIKNYTDGGKINSFETYFREYEQDKNEIPKTPRYLHDEWIKNLSQGFNILSSDLTSKPKYFKSNQGDLRRKLKYKAFKNKKNTFMETSNDGLNKIGNEEERKKKLDTTFSDSTLLKDSQINKKGQKKN